MVVYVVPPSQRELDCALLRVLQYQLEHAAKTAPPMRFRGFGQADAAAALARLIEDAYSPDDRAPGRDLAIARHYHALLALGSSHAKASEQVARHWHLGALTVGKIARSASVARAAKRQLADTDGPRHAETNAPLWSEEDKMRAIVAGSENVARMYLDTARERPKPPPHRVVPKKRRK